MVRADFGKALKARRLGWSLASIVLAVIALLTFAVGSRYLRAVQRVEHTVSAQAAINAALSTMKDAETGMRGYVLTADPRFLEPYAAALAQLPAQLDELARLMRDDPKQSDRLRTLRATVEEKRALMAEIIGTTREGNQTEALVRVQLGKGKAVMDSIRVSCAAMLDDEKRTLDIRKREAELAERAAIALTLAGACLTILLALTSLLSVGRDVAALERSTEALTVSEAHYRLLTEQSSDLVRLLNPRGAVTYVSPSVERLLGYTVDEYIAIPPKSLMHPDELKTADEILAKIATGTQREGTSTYRLRHKSGEFRWFEVRWAVRHDDFGRLQDMHTVARDVTARLEAEQKLNEQAAELRSLSLRDELTGLYNRRGFLEVAGQAHRQASRDGRHAALIFVDLNGMKQINDTLGHKVGDLALADAARVLSETLRPGDVLARLGGDEFVVFALDFGEPDVETLRAQLRVRADHVVAECARPFRLSMSTGAAYLKRGAETTFVALLAEADAAMYAQKAKRRAAGGISIPPQVIDRASRPPTLDTN